VGTDKEGITPSMFVLKVAGFWGEVNVKKKKPAFVSLASGTSAGKFKKELSFI